MLQDGHLVFKMAAIHGFSVVLLIQVSHKAHNILLMLYVMTPKHVYILMLIKTRWPPFTFSGAITETACTFVNKL